MSLLEKNIKQKNTKLKILQKDIKELNDLFKELDGIIWNHNEHILDTIEKKISITKYCTENANINIKKSHQFQYNSTIRKIIMGSFVGFCIGGPIGASIGGIKSMVGCSLISGFITTLI